MTRHMRHALLVLVGVFALCAEAMSPRGAAGYASGNAHGQRRMLLTSDHTQSQALHQRQHDEKPSSTSSSRSSATPGQARDDTLQASIQIAARQALFDYATQQGLAMLVQRVTGLAVPDVTKTFHLPVIGDFELRLYTIRVQEFTVPHEDARLVILDKFFNLWVEQVSTHVTFDWHWEKPGLGIQGTGDGELFLRNGVINYVFSVAKSDETSRPKLDVKVADSFFESTDVRIHSFSADWLYQAVLSLFNERINTAINKGIAHALSDDVPSALDNVLASLPTRVDIKGLPFVTAFDYSIYTYSYVLLKGYGEVEAPTAASGQASAAGQAASSGADTQMGAGAGAGEGTGAGGLEQQQQHQQHQQQQQQGKEQVLLDAAATTSSASHLSTLATPDTSASSSQLQRCPFAASELPISGQALASEPHMVTLYLHESLLNCMAWGMFNAGSLKFSVVDGAIPKLHLTTDLMAMLIPQLPKTYPHQLMRIDAEALSAPTASFKADLVTVDAAYRTTIYVDNQTLGVPLVAQLDAHVTITGMLSWDTTTIATAVVNHSLVQSTMDVPLRQWDTTVAWFIQNYAGLYPLQFLVNQFVKTPVTSLVALVNANGVSLDGWFALSGDVQLQNLALT